MRPIALAALVLTAGTLSAVPTRSSTHAGPSPCVFARQWGTSVVCTPFTTVGMRILRVIPNVAFGKDARPDDVAVLDDGAVLVHTDRNGLFRIVQGRITAVWLPRSACPPWGKWSFDFEQVFDDEVLGRFTTQFEDNRTHVVHTAASWLGSIRADGSTAFRWPPSPATTETIAKDASGVIWATNKASQQLTLFAYFPQANRVVTVDFDGIVKLFRSLNGRVYASNDRGLFVLESRPKVRARMVRRSIGGAFQGVGRDGSLWATTPYQVLHLHPNGTIVRLQLGDPLPPAVSLGDMPRAPNIDLSMAPDGAVWTTGQLVRIGNDDRITVVEQPANADRGDVHFAPDSTMWTLARDTRSSWGAPFGIVNFAPAATMHGDAWPFTDLPTPTQPTPPTPCPPPPTPFVPLPPQSGAVYYVYAIAAQNSGIWGYWADAHGRMKSLRGSPYLAGTTGAATIAIDPTGRFAYAGSWYDGIFGYAIDPVSGGLHAMPGSPFKEPFGPATITIDSAGRYAYANDYNAKSISVYLIDRSTGVLRAIAGSPFAVNGRPSEVVLNEKRRVAYLFLNNSIETYSAAAAGFRLLTTVHLSHDRTGASGIVVDPAGRWTGVMHLSGDTMARYDTDPRTGGLRMSQQVPLPLGRDFESYVEAFAANARARLLYFSTLRGKRNVYGFRIDARSGNLIAIAGSPFAGAVGPEGMSVTPDDALLFVTNSGASSLAAFRIDRRTGALTYEGSSNQFRRFPNAVAPCKRIGSRCVPR